MKYHNLKKKTKKKLTCPKDNTSSSTVTAIIRVVSDEVGVSDTRFTQVVTEIKYAFWSSS